MTRYKSWIHRDCVLALLIAVIYLAGCAAEAWIEAGFGWGTDGRINQAVTEVCCTDEG